MSKLDQRLEETGTEIRAMAATLAERPLRRAERGRRTRTAVAVAGVTMAAVFIGGAVLWLGGGSGNDSDVVAGTGSTPADPAITSPAPSTNGGGITAVQAMLAIQPTRAVTIGNPMPSSGDGDSFPYLVLDLPGTELDEAYEVLDARTAEQIGIQTVYHQWWTDENGETVGREILFRVQHMGQDFEWFTILSGLAESTESVRIGERYVTVYRIPDESIEEGTYDLDVFYWVEEPGVEAVLIPWGLAGDEAFGLMAGLQLLDVNEWLAQAGPPPDPGAPATTTTIVGKAG